MLYPVPAVMVSCGREGEKPNIITVAWVGNICSSPAMLSISVRPERYSHSIIKETGEFVVNLTSRSLTYATDWCGVKSGRDFDKFKEMHLTPMKMEKVSCPGIAESPVNIECKVKQILPLGSHDLFIAEVVCVDADEAYLDEKGRLDLQKADLVAYSHGDYFSLGEKLGKFGYSVSKSFGVKNRSEGKNVTKTSVNSVDNKKKQSKRSKDKQQIKEAKGKRRNGKKIVNSKTK